MASYSEEIVKISENFLEISFPFGINIPQETREKIVNAIKATPTITVAELADQLGITNKGVEWQISKLKSEKMIQRVGPAKGGHWEVLNNE